jgi:hypothetical protein
MLTHGNVFQFDDALKILFILDFAQKNPPKREDLKNYLPCPRYFLRALLRAVAAYLVPSPSP